MNADAVLVSFTVEGHPTTYETSGILFNTDTVILTGTALIPLVHQEKWIALLVNSSSSKLQANSCVQKLCFRVHVEPQGWNEKQEPSAQLSSFEGKAVGVWKCPLVSLSTKKLFTEWTVGHARVENKSWDLLRDDIDLSKELMSIFIIVKCIGRGNSEQRQETNKSDDIVAVLLNFLSGLRNANRGQEVEVVSTPFGHKHFVNSVSRGVISNAVGCENCIILSDARTVSGCEGGPIFLSKGSGESQALVSRKEQKRGELVGMVTYPLSWWRGEWVGLTIGIGLLPVVKKLLQSEKDIFPSRNISVILSQGAGMNDKLTRPKEHLAQPDINLITFRDSPFKFIDESVVLVRSKDSWGTGVVLHGASGIVLTCSHVVKDDELVSVFLMKNQWSTEVIFKSQNDVAYDLAIIKIKNNCGKMKEVQFAENPAKIGETVIAAGFPFFSVEDDVEIRPSVVSGCISRVNPYMIQTTCCIQSGFSGGPLFRDGKLLGIIVSNTVGSGALYPHINFITPSSVFKEPILKYIRTNDILSLKELESSNVQVQYLWKLHTCKL